MPSFQTDFNRMNPVAHKHKLGDMIQMSQGIMTRGGYWFVDAENGDDSASGKIINQPVKTIQKALTLIAANRTASGKVYDEFIILMPTNGTDYDDDTVGASLTAAYVYINIPNVHIIGGGFTPNEVVINPDAAATAGVFNIGSSGKRVSFHNITIKTTTAQSAAIKLAAASDFLLVDNCIFDLVGAAGPLGIGIDGDAGKLSYPVIRNCTFWMGTLLISAVTLEVQDASPYGGLIENCNFISVLNGAGTPVVDVINIKDGTGMIIRDCNIHGGDTGSSYNAADGIDIDAGVVNTLITRNSISGCDALITDNGTDTDSVFNWTADGEGGEFADAEICIEPDVDTWKTTIDYLIKNPDYYMQITKNQYNFLNGRWMENNLNEWLDAL